MVLRPANLKYCHTEAFSLTLSCSAELGERVEGQRQNSTLFSPQGLKTQYSGIPSGTYVSLRSCAVSEMLQSAPTMS